jgi:predicted nucleic acid-binding protein
LSGIKSALSLISMILPRYQQAYQKLEQLFQQLQMKTAVETVTSADLKSELSEIQQIQQQVAAFQLEPSDQETIDFDFQAQFQPIQTEVTKQLRLLETDLLFLQTARQPAKAQHYKQRIADRLTLLQRYCAAILAL